MVFIVMTMLRVGRADAEVIALDTATFKRDVLNSREPWVVSFTAAEGCEICAYVGGKYEEAARGKAAATLGVKFGVFDVSAKGVELDELAQLVSLRTIPMVLAYPTYKTENPYDRRRSAKTPTAYPIAAPDGRVNDVSARSFTTFAEKALPIHLIERVEITGDAVSEDVIVSKGDAKMPTAVLLSNKATTSSLLKAISHELEGRMRIIEIVYPSSASNLPRLPGVDASQSPRLVVYPAGTLTPEIFNSDALKAENVREFLTTNAGPEVELELDIRTANGGAKKSDSTNGAQDDAHAPQPVLAPLRGADFQKTVIDDDRYHVVVFTKSSDACDTIVKALPERFESFRGTVALHEVIVGGADADANALLAKKSLGLFADESACVDIAAFPESDEGDARDVELFKPSSTAKISGYAVDSLATFIMSHIMDLSVQVDAKNIDTALFGREPRKPKVLLFMEEGDETSHDAIRLLSSAHKDFIFAVTTSTDEQLVNQFQISKRPEVVVLSMKEDDTDAAVGENGVGMRMNVHKYPAQVFMQQIATVWIEQLRAQIYGVDAAALNIPVPSTVDDQAQFNAECAEKGGLCVVAHIKDDNPAHVKIFHELATSLHDKPFHFVIIDPSTQRSFASVFEVNNPADYPTVTVLAVRRQRAVTHKKEFDLPLLKAFCQDVLNSKVKTWRFQDMPTLVPGGERAEEVIEEIVEEEFDLSDIMGESVEGEAAMSREELAAKLAMEEAAAEAERKAAEAERKAAEDAAKPKKSKKKKSKKKKVRSEL